MALAFRPSTSHQCHLCPKHFSRAYYLRSHLDAHQGIKRYRCTECQTPFVRKNDLRVHLIEKHSTGNAKPTFCCHQTGPDGAVNGCGKIFPRKSLLARHLRGAKAASCRGGHVLPLSLLDGATPFDSPIPYTSILDPDNKDEAENHCRLPPSSTRSADCSTDMIWDQACQHISDLNRRHGTNDPANIQFFVMDSFIDWNRVGYSIIAEVSGLLADSRIIVPPRRNRPKPELVHWRCIYASAITLTRRLLSNDSDLLYSHVAWLSILVAISRAVDNGEDFRTHISELKRYFERFYMKPLGGKTLIVYPLHLLRMRLDSKHVFSVVNDMVALVPGDKHDVLVQEQRTGFKVCIRGYWIEWSNTQGTRVYNGRTKLGGCESRHFMTTMSRRHFTTTMNSSIIHRNDGAFE